MMSFRKLAAGAFAMALLVIPLAALLFLTGCRKQAKIFVDENFAPDTRLTSAPGPYVTTNYRIHMYWNGVDPDGFVVAYHFAWDDTVPPYGAQNSPWRLTTNSDTLFKALVDSGGETRRHTFYVRAVDNEGKLDPSPARIRFDAQTDEPKITFLYRVDGPLDPSVSDTLYPDGKDTVLMGTPVRFIWSGWDPDGYDPIEDEWAQIEYTYTMDNPPWSPFGDSTSATVPTVSSGTHDFHVKGRDETGAVMNSPSSYKFVMNFVPDSHIIEPTEPTGTLAVLDGDTIRFRWSARDKEELLGQGGGLHQIWINLDNDFLKGFTVDTTGHYVNEWYFTSNVAQSDSHYIASRNSPQGGNAPHLFEIWARDVELAFERPSELPEDRETYTFWYNRAPTSEIIFPADGDTLCPDFEILWEGTDVDGEIAAYQFVLDPWASAYRVCQVDLPEQACTSWTYEGIEPTGPHEYHEFRVRAQDNAGSGCWEESWNTVRFYVKECE